MMRRLPYLIAVLAALLLISGAHGHPCSAPEANTVLLNDYNPLVCDGVRLQQRGEFAAAFAKIERASKLPVGEWVNFDLFPRLAILSYRLGNHDDYRAYLLRSKYGLEIFHGFIQCDTEFTSNWNVGYEELYKRGEVGLIKDGKRIQEPTAEEMFYHMCMGIMWDIYRMPTDLDKFLNDGIVRLYMEALSLGEKKEP